MGGRVGAALCALAASLAIAAPASAGWTRLSSASDNSNIVVPALFQLPSAQFVAAYRRTVTGNQNVVDTSSFGVTPAGALTGLAHRVALGPWGNIDDPQLLPGAGGQPLLLDSGIVGTPTGIDGTFYQQRGASGLFAAPLVVDTSTNSGAPGPGVILKSGQPAFPSAAAGALHVWVGSPTATDVDLTAFDVGTSYIPRLGFDKSGRLWLAWYVLPGTDAGKGLYMLQLDPLTGAKLGSVLHAPRSQSITNESLSIAMACNAVCRVVYHETAADNVLNTGRIVSWAPGEGLPTVVAGARGSSAVGPYLSASATPAGNIWVAWHTPQDVYYAKRGNAHGAGGAARLLGQPPHTDLSDAFDLTTSALGNDQLLVATNFARTGGQFDVWATVARNFDVSGIPNPTVITDPSGAAVIPTKIARFRGRCLPLKLQAYKPATLLAWLYVGKRGKVRLTPRKLIKHYRGPGIQKGCLRLPKKPKGWYTARKFRLVVGFQAGFRPPRGAYTSTHSKLVKIKL